MSGTLTTAMLEAVRRQLLEIPPFSIVDKECMTAQLRFPRSKKKRIRRKWAKRPENFGPSKLVIYQEDTKTFFLHPANRRKFIEQMKAGKLKPLRIVRIPPVLDTPFLKPESPATGRSKWAWTTPFCKTFVLKRSPAIKFFHFST